MGAARFERLGKWNTRGIRQARYGTVLLANHGVLVTGDTPEVALNRLTALEEAAELVLHARVLGGEKALPDAAYREVAERMQRFRKAS